MTNDITYELQYAGGASERAPYLRCFETGDVCDFYFKRPDGGLQHFECAEAHARRLQACANAFTGISSHAVKNGLLLRFVLWLYRRIEA